ncbi:unnamed protein product [Thelazia callipaeda]|uniref:Ragulator complex protein LAMTOR1 n=1 Tax=Thelazia callipaeda TaxID=103827 RepID=A0A0N5DAC1_THECL|nr:unnamed protein product [Thelazia callipaeda]
MYTAIRTLCCCKAEDDVDERPLITDRDNDHFGATVSSDLADSYWVDDRAINIPRPHYSSSGPDSFKPDNEEDELLNQILETTQQNIIDVANIDGGTVPSKEDLLKAQKYSDAIKQHDLRLRKHVSAPLLDDDPCLLSDAGVRAVDLLREPARPFSELRDLASRLSDAMTKGVQIEHKEDVLIHMTFSDD